ncbi:DUF922 domain-containing protein [Aeromonas taiwanensis]|uniref:DUF922 domain-containing protein n=1 Tax=Aeromonas taiwanensis TaxID=633417 RepID=A0A5F0K6X4_9GAMM|nr:DUF922 domain-containing protein [Aeromonas taiwanensis]MCO4203904.1 DUF922 domain-containing Zn-dependent protease [Aeromonas taiwanensis]TFF72269.1 DUF922 domain-containing protein [Aeromonas taiwanensis]TFF73580.1 DUF922 domain-containing protein [Aeromonas taiwanensis]TFF75618.1 DUF922 domain-containing protein [Aeromonas taiwanensis]
MGLFSKTGVVAALMYAASIGAAPSHYSGIRVVPDIKVDFQFYRVSGADVAAVMRQITALSPAQADGHIGRASYQLSWQLQTRPTPARCELDQADVTVRIKVRVPNWMDKARAPEKERQKWDKLVAAMFDYESRHKDILLESVSQLGIRLAQMPVTTSCEALQHQGWQEGQAALEATRERFATLAKQTEQGRKLGVIWPVRS